MYKENSGCQKSDDTLFFSHQFASCLILPMRSSGPPTRTNAGHLWVAREDNINCMWFIPTGECWASTKSQSNCRAAASCSAICGELEFKNNPKDWVLAPLIMFLNSFLVGYGWTRWHVTRALMLRGIDDRKVPLFIFMATDLKPLTLYIYNWYN